VSFARRKHARVQQAKFCRLYSGDIVEMLYDTQARYAVQVLEISASGLPLMRHTPVVPSLFSFETVSGDIPASSSQAAKQALQLGKDAQARARPEVPLFRLHSAGSGGASTPPPLARLSSSAAAEEETGEATPQGDGQQGVEDTAFEAAAARRRDRSPEPPDDAGADPLGRGHGLGPRVLSAVSSSSSAAASSRSINRLPSYSLARLLSFLPLPDLLSAATVCRRWERVVNTSGVLSHVRVGAFCPGVIEPPFRLLLGLAARTRWCLAHLSLARCRWATAGHLAMLLGLPIGLRPHPFSVAIGDPDVRDGDSDRTAFAPDGDDPSDPCAASPPLVALGPIPFDDDGTATEAAGPLGAVSSSALGPSASSSSSSAPSASSHIIPDALAALPFNLVTPESAVSFLPGAPPPTPVHTDASTRDLWRLKTVGRPRRLLDGFLALFANRTLRAMSRAEAAAIQAACLVRGEHPPEHRTVAHFIASGMSLQTPVDERALGPLASVNDTLAFNSLADDIGRPVGRDSVTTTDGTGRFMAASLLAANVPLAERRPQLHVAHFSPLPSPPVPAPAGSPAAAATVDSATAGALASGAGLPAGSPAAATLAAAGTLGSTGEISAPRDAASLHALENRVIGVHIAPRDPFLEDVAGCPSLAPADASTPASCTVLVPGGIACRILAPTLGPETFPARIAAASHIRRRAAVVAWAECKLEGVRPGFPGGLRREAPSLFHAKEATMCGHRVKGPRALRTERSRDDPDVTAALDRLSGNHEGRPELRRQERPVRSGFFDARLGRYPLGHVLVATSAPAEPVAGPAARAGDAATEPQSPRAPDTDSENGAECGSQGGGAAVAAGAAGSDDTESDEGGEDDDDEAGAAGGYEFRPPVGPRVPRGSSLTTLRTAAASLGGKPGSTFAMLDSRGDVIDPCYLYTASNILVAALQEHSAAGLPWTTAWAAPAAAVRRVVPGVAAGLPTDAAVAAAEAVAAGTSPHVSALQAELLDDISTADVVTWVPSPGFRSSFQAKPRPVTERRAADGSWLPPTRLRRLSDPLPSVFASGVRSLDLHGCVNMQPMALLLLLRYCPHLTALRLGGMLQLSAPVLLALPACVPSLCLLDLEGVHHVTDGVLHAVARFCPGLERANFDGCVGITAEGLVAPGKGLARRCRSLRHLSLRGCDHISGTGFVELCGALPGLVSLNLAGNQEISVAHLARALVLCPDLDTLKVEIWHKEDSDHARFRILENVRRAARYCFKNLPPDDPEYGALAGTGRFEEALRASIDARATTDDADDEGLGASRTSQA